MAAAKVAGEERAAAAKAAEEERAAAEAVAREKAAMEQVAEGWAEMARERERTAKNRQEAYDADQELKHRRADAVNQASGRMESVPSECKECKVAKTTTLRSYCELHSKMIKDGAYEILDRR
jgi:hypothetical protein